MSMAVITLSIPGLLVGLGAGLMIGIVIMCLMSVQSYDKGFDDGSLSSEGYKRGVNDGIKLMEGADERDM